MKRSLQLVWDPSQAPPAAPEAWFLTGHDPSAWLAKLVEAGLAHSSTRLFIVPRSISDPAPAGVLAIPDPTHHPILAAQPPSGWACRCLAGRLYIPAQAILHPPVSDPELIALCAWPIAFFHPLFGLSGFDQESRIAIEQLLVAPAVSPVAWNHARPAPPPLPELNHLQVQVPEHPSSLYGDAANDIGIHPTHQLPPLPNEPRPGPMGRLLRAWLRGLPSPRVPPSSHADTTAPPHPPAGSIARWIQQRLAPNGPSNAEVQQRELERLVHLLDADPDAGLRHAPPITSLEPQDGTTEPVDALPQRKPDFNLNTLSGEPAAAWNVSPSVLELLRLRYRELADRELRLGRFRRAAYIYAHLLGDLVSAAHALKRGGHFHEAAILYETRLHNPLEAARCLVAGGFFDEAIPRLEKLCHWFEVAEIHERLGNTAAAAAAFRRDAADQLQSGNPAGAALILSGKLQAHDEALAVLDAGWPHTMVADRCFELSFRILADLGRHDEALQRLRTFAASPIPERLQSSVINILCDFSRTYPDPRVRHRASDLVRSLVGDQLSAPSANSYELRERVKPLFKLATGDLLFSRDVNRYVLQRLHPHLKAPSASVTSPRPPDRFVPQLIRRIHLGRSARWTSLRSHGPEFFAAGTTRQNTLVVRGLWSGETQDVIWPNPPVRPSHSTLLLELLPDATASLLVALGPRESLPQRTLPAQFPAFPHDLSAGTPPWLPAPLLAVAASSDVLWCVYRTPEDRQVLACLSFAGDVHSTLDVTHFTDPPSPGSPPHPFHLAAVGRSVALAQQTRLDLIDVSGGRQFSELPYPVTALIPTRNTGRAGVVALLESGAVHRWESRPTLVPFAEGFRASHGAFLDRSHLVLISGEACQTFACEASEVRSLGLFPIQHPKASGLVPTANPRECAVLDSDGVITVYQVLPDPADKPSATGHGLPIQTPSSPGE